MIHQQKSVKHGIRLVLQILCTFAHEIKELKTKMTMKRKITLFAALTMALGGMAQNPFVQTWYTSDPAPMVHDGTMYVYTGHDEDNADFFWMQEWRVYSTQDMVALESFSWADDRAWAAQTIERNGKFYWYICAHSKLTNGMAIGVAVSDSPTGPFRDA